MQLPGICIQHICTILQQRLQLHALSPEPRNAAAVASKASASAVLSGMSKATKRVLTPWISDSKKTEDQKHGNTSQNIDLPKKQKVKRPLPGIDTPTQGGRTGFQLRILAQRETLC